MNSRAKGQRGELELAETLRAFGVAARRGRQYCGDPSAPDVVHDLAGVHFEGKRTECVRLYDWLDQAIADAGDKMPIVCHRKNRGPWVAIVRLEDLLPLLIRAGSVAIGD